MTAPKTSVEPFDPAEFVSAMRAMSLRGLERMYDANAGRFVFCIRRTPDGDRSEGLSLRYTAIALIGLATESEDVVRKVLGGESPGDVLARLSDGLEDVGNLGDVSLILWAAKLLEHGAADKALRQVQLLDPVCGPHTTVEVSWALAAMCVPGGGPGEGEIIKGIFGRLHSSFVEKSGIFTHWPKGVTGATFRSHVSCFADLVYPVQALSYYYQATGNPDAIDAAKHCASLMCRRQGPAGQWWWHFDARSGHVVEGYPVYAVHQDAMAPMALFALRDACGADHSDAIRKGLGWLWRSPEIDETLVDRDADLIWRKVARREPGKTSRGIQALASSVYQGFRVPGLNAVFPPGRVDFECRPYHLGWLLHAWPEGRVP
jgi:hypothetical protein